MIKCALKLYFNIRALPQNLNHHPDNAHTAHRIDNGIQPAELTFLSRDFLYQLKVLLGTVFKESKDVRLYLLYPFVTILQNCFTVIFQELELAIRALIKVLVTVRKPKNYELMPWFRRITSAYHNTACSFTFLLCLLNFLLYILIKKLSLQFNNLQELIIIRK